MGYIQRKVIFQGMSETGPVLVPLGLCAILGSQMSLSLKYLQSLHTPGILSPKFSVLEHWPTNHKPTPISLDQQTSNPACQSDSTVQLTDG